MTGFDKYLKRMLDGAATEARLDGSTTVEAQHLLLAIAADAGSSARPGSGLGRARPRRDPGGAWTASSSTA